MVMMAANNSFMFLNLKLMLKPDDDGTPFPIPLPLMCGMQLTATLLLAFGVVEELSKAGG